MRLWTPLPLAALLCLSACAAPLTLPVEQNRVYVLGSVPKQVVLDYEEGMTILDALGKAEFPDADALRMRVRWVDKSGPLLRKRNFSYNAVAKGGASNAALHPGDIIYVYRHPIYVVLDFIERLLQPARSLISSTTPILVGTTE